MPVTLGLSGVQAGQREDCPEKVPGPSSPSSTFPSLALLPRSSMPCVLSLSWRASTAQWSSCPAPS